MKRDWCSNYKETKAENKNTAGVLWPNFKEVPGHQS